MKRKIVALFLSVFALFLSGTLFAAGEPEAKGSAEDALIARAKNGEWLVDYDNALAAAKALKRPILINFTGSDWCGWCIKLHQEVFAEKEFMKYAKKELVLLKIDFPNRKKLPEEQQKKNTELARKFRVRGFPTIFLVDSEGKQIGMTGYRRGGAKAYVKHLKDLIKGK